MEDPADRQPLDGSWAVAVPAAVDAPAPAADATPALRVRAADRVLSGLEVFLCSGFPSQLLLAVALQALGWSPFGPSGTLSLRYIATLSLVDTLVIVLLAHWFLVSRGDRPRRVYLGDRPLGREALLGALVLPAILLGIATLSLSLSLRHLAPWLHNVAENPLEALMRDPVGLAVFAVVVVLAGGVREEVQRAFVLHRFRQHLGGPRVGLWLFSVMFGVGHLIQGYDAAILTAVLGVVWGALYLRRGSIVAPMVSHSLFNLAEIVKQALFA